MAEKKENEFFQAKSSMSSRSASSDIKMLNENSTINSSNDNGSIETDTSSSSVPSEDRFIFQMMTVLGLDPRVSESKMLINHLIVNGRQALSKYEADIKRGTYKTQMTKGGSELLTLLKGYNEYQWQNRTEDWLRTFLQKQKQKSPNLYDRILTCFAEYGVKYLKDYPSLSLVLQFLVDFNDEELQNEAIFDPIGNTLFLHGRGSLAKFPNHLAKSVIKEQADNDRSPTSLALRESFHQPLVDLLSDNEPDLIQVSLDSVVQHGWIEGLNQEVITDSFTPRQHGELIERANKYLTEKNIKLSDPISNTTPTTENPILMNSSIPSIEQTTPGSSSNHSSSIKPTPAPPTIPVVHNPDNDGFFDTQSSMTSFNLDNRTNHGHDERMIITMCTDGYEKWQLANLVQAGELMYINQKFHEVIEQIVLAYGTKRNITEFLDECLQSMMFLLKRHQKLEDFSRRLFFHYFDLDESSTFPVLNLRMMQDILLLKSDFSLSRMLISLLSKRNHVPFLQPSIGNDSNYRFVPEIIYVWDYDTPTLLSFGIDQCEGKSILLNTIFMTTFEQTTSSIYFEQTIDIDFAYNFIPRRPLNIADTHGSMSAELLTKIHNLFDGFIMHVNYQYLKQNFDTVRSYLAIVSQKSRYCLLLIRDVPENQCSKEFPVKFPPSIQTYSLPNVSDPNKAQNQRFILKLYQKILETAPKNPLHEKHYIQTLLKNLFNPYFNEQMREISQVIQPLEDRLFFAAQNEHVVNDHFPLYLIYAKLCGLHLKLASFNFFGNKNDTDVFSVHQQIAELDNRLNKKGENTGIIFDLFMKVLQSSNMLTCLDVLATDLKNGRSRLVPIREMSKQLPVHKSLSLEILWRNAIICELQQSEQLQQLLYQRYYEYIRAGYPFEIVDGDNFFFHNDFLGHALSLFQDKKILVISVIGPQNSGKSTLLNYMFGTLFDVRDGRCTRGIYGSFVKSNRPDFDYIMLIDTEGLLGVEREDLQYDRRIVLFCLAVSHLVIVNTAGEFNIHFQKMLALCTDSLRHMGVTRIPQPTIRFILNQKADLNNENNVAAIERIVGELNATGPTVNLETESFHTLPSAFKKGANLAADTDQATPVNTEVDFLERVQLLCGALIQAANSVFSSSTEFSDPLQWLKSSFTIFETLRKFSDLTYYHDIHERQQDNEIREHIQKKLKEVFSTSYENQLIQESMNKQEKDITRMFDIRQERVQKDAEKGLENVLKLLKTSDTIRTRSKQFLNTQIIAAFNALRTSSMAANDERERVKLLVRDGEGDLRQLIENTINSGSVMSQTSASLEFEQMFEKSVYNIRSRFLPRELVEKALNHIYTNYVIYETGLLDYQYILNYLPMLVRFNESQLAIPELEDELIIFFTKLANEGHGPVEIHPFIHHGINVYSFEQIDSLVYLNKDIFYQQFIEYSSKNYQLSYQQQEQLQYASNSNSSKGGIRQFWKDFTSNLRNNKQKNKKSPSLSDTVFYTTKFLQEVRFEISHPKPIEGPAVVDEPHRYLRVSVFIKEIIQTVFNEMKGAHANQTRQIQTDLIQKIVGLINTLIINIDNELSPFCLSLSRQLKSIFHICAILLLTTFYFSEQKRYFQETLDELNTKKNHMKDYFVQMVVPNSSADASYASALVKELLEYTIKCCKFDCQQLIKTEIQVSNSLNRQWMQDRCDGQLQANNDMRWLMNYIENPTKIIEEDFNQLWQNILRTINQKLIDIKSNFNSVLEEFFFCLQGMSILSSINCLLSFFSNHFRCTGRIKTIPWFIRNICCKYISISRSKFSKCERKLNS